MQTQKNIQVIKPTLIIKNIKNSENIENIKNLENIENIELMDEVENIPENIPVINLNHNIENNIKNNIENNIEKSAAKNELMALPQNMPALQSFEHYIQTIQRIPILSGDEEITLINRWHQTQNPEAAKRLVMAHLRLVYAISRQYLGYGLATADVMQEGTLGLMMAVKKFEPKFNVRLATYATYWIKAYIHEYILQNWRLVKIASTVTQKKLFFKLRSLLPPDSSVTQQDLQRIAEKLNVNIADVREMQMRLKHPEQSFEVENEAGNLHDVLADHRPDPSMMLEHAQKNQTIENLPQMLEGLRHEKPRVFDIIQKRWFSEQKTTMKDLSKEMNISIERVNQLEKQGLQWLKARLLSVV